MYIICKLRKKIMRETNQLKGRQQRNEKSRENIKHNIY